MAKKRKKGLLTLLTQLHKIMLRSSLYEIRMLDEEEDPLVVEEETLKSSAEDEVTFISK